MDWGNTISTKQLKDLEVGKDKQNEKVNEMKMSYELTKEEIAEAVAQYLQGTTGYAGETLSIDVFIEDESKRLEDIKIVATHNFKN